VQTDLVGRDGYADAAEVHLMVTVHVQDLADQLQTQLTEMVSVAGGP